MTGGFSNPVIGGQGALVRELVKSPDFVADTSGWEISKDGSAQFNNLTIRGTFYGTSFILNDVGLFLYQGTPGVGTLQISLAPNAGHDPFGNSVSAGLAFYDTIVGGVLSNFSEYGGLTMSDPNGRGLVISAVDLPMEISTTVLPTGSTPANLRAYNGIVSAGQDTAVLTGPRSPTASDPNLSAAQILLTQGNGADNAQGSLAIDDNGGTHDIITWIKTLLSVATRIAVTSGDSGGAITINQTTPTTTQPATITDQETAAGNGALAVYVAGDGHARMVLRGSGQMEFGSGAASPDAYLKRQSAGVMVATDAGGGHTFCMVHSYSAVSTADLMNFTAQTDIPDASVSVVVKGTNATVKIWGTFDSVAGTSLCTLLGFMVWNGNNQPYTSVFIASSVGDRKTVTQMWRITGVTAGTYTAKLAGSCSVAGASNGFANGHCVIMVEVEES